VSAAPDPTAVGLVEPAPARPLVSWLIAVRYVDAIPRPAQQKYGRAYLAWKASQQSRPLPLPSHFGLSPATAEVIGRTIEHLLALPPHVPARPPRRRRPSR
jgi:hypothetical protein